MQGALVPQGMPGERGGFGVPAEGCSAPLLPRAPWRDGAVRTVVWLIFWFPHQRFLCANLLPPRSGDGRGRGGGKSRLHSGCRNQAGGMVSILLPPAPGLGLAGFWGSCSLSLWPGTPRPCPSPVRERVKRKEAESLVQNTPLCSRLLQVHTVWRKLLAATTALPVPSPDVTVAG